MTERMTVSLRANEVTRSKCDRIVADIKATGRYHDLRVVRVLTEPVLVYGKRWEFDVEAEPR